MVSADVVSGGSHDGQFETVIAAASVLQSTAFRLIVPHSDAQPMKESILRGMPLRAAEVKLGLAVKRRLKERDGEIPFDQVFQWLADKRGSTVLIVGEPGEGKTTFKNMLVTELSSSKRVFVEWNLKHPSVEWDKLHQLTDMIRTSTKEDTIVVVVAEIVEGLGERDLDSICTELIEREGKTNRDPFVVLLFGRPSRVLKLKTRVGAEEVSLAPLNDTEVRALCRSLVRVYRELLEEGSNPATLTQSYPNLRHFQDLGTAGQMAVFLEQRKSLLVGLLEAVYGQRFWERLIDELDELEPMDKQAYLHICLASSAGEPIPEDSLRVLAPDSDLDSHCEGNPWLRDENAFYSARHRLIAKTVLENMRNSVLLEQCLSDWLSGIEHADVPLELVVRLFEEIAEWESTAPTRGDFRGIIQSRSRRAIKNNPSLARQLAISLRSDPWGLYRWSRVWHLLTPTEPKMEHLYLIEGNLDLLKELTMSDLPQKLLKRLPYLQDKNDVLRESALGLEENRESLETRIGRWADMMGGDWCGSDFYIDLFNATAKLLEWMTFPIEGGLKQDSKELFNLYRVAAVSFEQAKLLLTDGGRSVSTGAEMRYASLVSRFMYHALPTRYLEVLNSAWDVSAKTNLPNVRTGIHYARRLVPVDREGARKVLRKVLDASPSRGDAQLLFVKVVDNDEQLAEAQAYLEKGVRAQPTGSSLTMLQHALAIVDSNAQDRAQLLSEVVAGYSIFVTNVDNWNDYGEWWQEA